MDINIHDGLGAVVTFPSPNMDSANRDFVTEPRRSMRVDHAGAVNEQRAYIEALREEGVNVIVLDEHDSEFATQSGHLPDRVFLEDVMRQFDHVWVQARMGVASRAPEPDFVVPALRRLGIVDHRKLHFSSETFEAGDILQFHRPKETIVFFGLSTRSHEPAYHSLEALLRAHQNGTRYTVVPVQVNCERCLHLTTGSGKCGKDTVLVNPELVDPAPFSRMGIQVLEVAACDNGQLNAANCLWIPPVAGGSGKVLVDGDFPATERILNHAGFVTRALPNWNHGHVQGGLTCRSFRFGRGWSSVC